MNILYIMRYWPVYGGGETITVTLANELIKRGHQVYVAYTGYKDIHPMPYVLDEKIHAFQMHTIEYYSKSDIFQLHNYITSHKIDIMINQWGDVELCDKARKHTECKLITCWHIAVLLKLGNNSSFKHKIAKFLFGDKYLQTRYNKKQLKRHMTNYVHSDRYVFLSKSFEVYYKKVSNNNDPQNKLYSIPNPLTYHYTYNMVNYVKKKKQVLFVGRINEYHKRVSYVLRIWKKIMDTGKYKDWSLKIVGDGPDMNASLALSSELGLINISFDGFKKPQPYYEESSIFVMTSSMEGFGMTLVEAQQYAVVPMAMDTYSSLHDIIEDGYNGIIVPDNDLEYYAEKLMKLMSDEEFRKRLAINGLEACKKFAVEYIANQWEKLFTEL